MCVWICIFDCFTKDPGCTKFVDNRERAMESRESRGVPFRGPRTRCAYFVADCCVCESVFKEPGCTKLADKSTTPMAWWESRGVYLSVGHTQGASTSEARFCVQHSCAGGCFLFFARGGENWPRA